MALPDTLKLNIGDAKDGACRIDLKVEEMHLNVEGVLHGGVVSTMIDMAIARAIRSVVPDDMQIMTVALQINFFGAVSDGVVEVVGRTLFEGKRLLHGEAELRAGDRLLARGTGTWYARPRKLEAPA